MQGEAINLLPNVPGCGSIIYKCDSSKGCCTNIHLIPSTLKISNARSICVTGMRYINKHILFFFPKNNFLRCFPGYYFHILQIDGRTNGWVGGLIIVFCLLPPYP